MKLASFDSQLEGEAQKLNCQRFKSFFSPKGKRRLIDRKLWWNQLLKFQLDKIIISTI